MSSNLLLTTYYSPPATSNWPLVPITQLATPDPWSLGLIIAAGILTALACWLLLFGIIYLLRGEGARVRNRVKLFVAGEGSQVVSEREERANMRAALFSNMDARWSRRSVFDKLRADLQKADIRITITEVLIIQLCVALALALVLWMLAPALQLLFALVGFLLGPLVVRAYFRSMGRRRINKFQEQLPDTLSILSTSVRGGFSLFQALQLIAREAPQPAKNEFLRVVQEVSLGANMDTALEGLASRIPTEDVDILVTAINLQHQTGGNLSHMLDVVAHTLRERQRIHREIHSLTAQARFSAILLTALPYMMAAVLFVIAPAYISKLFNLGWVLCMPIGAVIMSVLGFLVMRKIAAIDV